MIFTANLAMGNISIFNPCQGAPVGLGANPGLAKFVVFLMD